MPFIEKSIIKVFIGQRRVGKSYLLFQIIQQILEQDQQAKIIYINKDSLSYLLFSVDQTIDFALKNSFFLLKNNLNTVY